MSESEERLGNLLNLLSEEDMKILRENKDLKNTCKFLLETDEESARQIELKVVGAELGAAMNKAVIDSRSSDELRSILKGLKYIEDQTPVLRNIISLSLFRRKFNGGEAAEKA